MGGSALLKRAVIPMAVLVLLAAGCGDDSGSKTSSSATTATTVAAPKNIAVAAGMNDPKDPNVAVLQFMPAKVTVAVGTPVSWDWHGTEPHSVSFLKPGQVLPEPGTDTDIFAPVPATGPYDGSTFVSSGLQPLSADAPAPFEMTFSKAGTYEYHCVIHPQMVGTVEVVAAGAKVDSPAEVAAARAADQVKWLKEGRDAKAAFAKTQATSTKNADGSHTWTIQMGTSTPHTDVLAFAPTPAGIKAGDTVTFVNGSGAPHTASFFGTGAEQITSPVDPRVDAPAPGKSPQTLSSAGFFNTGLLPPNVPPGQGPPLAARSFSFKVPNAGSYSYVCLLHAPSSMQGSINAT